MEEHLELDNRVNASVPPAPPDDVVRFSHKGDGDALMMLVYALGVVSDSVVNSPFHSRPLSTDTQLLFSSRDNQTGGDSRSLGAHVAKVRYRHQDAEVDEDTHDSLWILLS